jgi:hypothetical protein
METVKLIGSSHAAIQVEMITNSEKLFDDFYAKD